MRLIPGTNEPPHDCQVLANAWQVHHESDGGSVYIGAKLECDCGKLLVYSVDIRGEKYWQPVVPEPGR